MLAVTLLALSITTCTAQELGIHSPFANIKASPANSRLLGGSFLKALSEFESGNDDNARGRDGEVSCYQILKSVWLQYGKGLNPKNRDHASLVASRIMRDRTETFCKLRGRMPSEVESYVLWNKPAHAMRGEWSRVTNEKAVRFANLMR